FIAQEVAFPVETMCGVLNVSRSGYYAWKRRPKPAREKADAQLAAQVAAVHQRSRTTYGSPRVHAELKARGVRVGRKRIERLMRESGLEGRRKRRFKRTTDSKHDGPIAPNVLARKFDVVEPNRAWVTDVTAISTDEGWLFLAAILDLSSRRVVGWATSSNNDTVLALNALQAALTTRKPSPGLVHHSDRGSPYASDNYRAKLREHGVRRSMSRKGDCWTMPWRRASSPRCVRSSSSMSTIPLGRRQRRPSVTISTTSTTSRDVTRISATSTPSSSNCVH